MANEMYLSTDETQGKKKPKVSPRGINNMVATIQDPPPAPAIDIPVRGYDLTDPATGNPIRVGSSTTNATPEMGAELQAQLGRYAKMPKVNTFGGGVSSHTDRVLPSGTRFADFIGGLQGDQAQLEQERQSKLAWSHHAANVDEASKAAVGENAIQAGTQANIHAKLENDQLKQFGGQNPHAAPLFGVIAELENGPFSRDLKTGMLLPHVQQTIDSIKQHLGLPMQEAARPPQATSTTPATPAHNPASPMNVFTSQAIPDIATGGAVGLASKAPGWWKVPAIAGAMLARGPIEKLTKGISGVDETDIAAHPNAATAGNIAGMAGGLGVALGPSLIRKGGKALGAMFGKATATPAGPGAVATPQAAVPQAPTPAPQVPTGTPTSPFASTSGNSWNVPRPPTPMQQAVAQGNVMQSGQPSMGGVTVPIQQQRGPSIANVPGAQPVPQVLPQSQPMGMPAPTVPGLAEANAKVAAAGLDPTTMDIATLFRVAASLP